MCCKVDHKRKRGEIGMTETEALAEHTAAADAMGISILPYR